MWSSTFDSTSGGLCFSADIEAEAAGDNGKYLKFQKGFDGLCTSEGMAIRMPVSISKRQFAVNQKRRSVQKKSDKVEFSLLFVRQGFTS
jgi:hypothetical protein